MRARSRQSAGLLLFRRAGGRIEVLLAHPGGPFWKRRDLGAWTIPKGEIDPGEDPLDAAVREFGEETGIAAQGPFLPLGSVVQRGGKTVHAWAFEGDCDPRAIRSGAIAIEWPRGSGRRLEIPEVDRAEFFPLDEARRRINSAQAALLDRLIEALREDPAV
jgi:predicted NUDIX family NTP pyrophosphohydrolase